MSTPSKADSVKFVPGTLAAVAMFLVGCSRTPTFTVPMPDYERFTGQAAHACLDRGFAYGRVVSTRPYTARVACSHKPKKDFWVAKEWLTSHEETERFIGLLNAQTLAMYNGDTETWHAINDELEVLREKQNKEFRELIKQNKGILEDIAESQP